MRKTLTKQGDDFAVTIEKSILESLGVSSETALELSTDGRSLILTPVRDGEDEQKFQAALTDVHQRFGDAMKKLAE